MNYCLHTEQIKYILYHLNLLIDLNDTILNKMVFVNKKEFPSSVYQNKIIFLLSDEPLKISTIKYIDNIPILFPNSDEKYHFYWRESNLIFTDDLFKSSFYLLSGYQEFQSDKKDLLGRFPFDNSIQKILNIIHKPLVNYYFEIIRSGIKVFCGKNNIRITEKNLFHNYGFMLTHDIDRVDAYTSIILLYKIKELLGFVKTKYTRAQNFKLIYKTLYELLKFSKKENPFWNFEYLLNTEKKYNFHSTFYFLPKETRSRDAFYDLKEERIVTLVKTLIHENCEIGLHGTINSAISGSSMKYSLNSLQNISSQKILGIRQHNLMFSIPDTFKLQTGAGLKYDTTLYFAGHEGFRNSFCLPFRPYDFIENKMIGIWEFPLTVMDSTLFHYQDLKISEASERIENLLSEIKKFKGLFILLWHNHYFDEMLFPGITNFYENLLKRIHLSSPENVLGKELINKLADFIAIEK